MTDIMMSMTKEVFDKQIENAKMEGFNKGIEVLLGLISEWKDSKLSPVEYYKSVAPKIPNKCLGQYFNIMCPDWLE